MSKRIHFPTLAFALSVTQSPHHRYSRRCIHTTLNSPPSFTTQRRPRCSLHSPSLPSATEIHSVKNARIKDTRTLLQRKHRERRNLILLEGQRLITDAIQANVYPEQIYYTPEAITRNESIARIRDEAVRHGALQFIVNDSVMQSLTDTITPQGVVAVCNKPNTPLPTSTTMLVICDQIQDPGNLGTLLRSAAASGACAVATTPGTTDVWSLKTLRSGMGAHFHLPVHSNMSWPTLSRYAQEHNLRIRVAALSPTAKSYTAIDWRQSSALVVGSEARGASEQAFENGECVKVPMERGVESLNAGMAGTVILFEAMRQRNE